MTVLPVSAPRAGKGDFCGAAVHRVPGRWIKDHGLAGPEASQCASGTARQQTAGYARRRDTVKGLGRGVRPSPISTGEGQFCHSARTVLLDADGVGSRKVAALGHDPPMAHRIRRAFGIDGGDDRRTLRIHTGLGGNRNLIAILRGPLSRRTRQRPRNYSPVIPTGPPTWYESWAPLAVRAGLRSAR